MTSRPGYHEVSRRPADHVLGKQYKSDQVLTEKIVSFDTVPDRIVTLTQILTDYNTRAKQYTTLLLLSNL